MPDRQFPPRIDLFSGACEVVGEGFYARETFHAMQTLRIRYLLVSGILSHPLLPNVHPASSV